MSIKSIEARRFYCILDLDLPYLKKGPLSITNDLICGGADIIQLRTKLTPAKYAIGIGQKIRYLTKKNNITVIINERVDIAEAVQADGVHLGQEDVSPELARRILGKDKIIGFSTHSLAQAETAQNYDIDYISFGPIFTSPTKPELKPVGVATLRKIARASNLAIVAIGGINLANIETVLSCGVNSVAIISAILKSENIRQRAREFKNRISAFYKKNAC